MKQKEKSKIASEIADLLRSERPKNDNAYEYLLKELAIVKSRIEDINRCVDQIKNVSAIKDQVDENTRLLSQMKATLIAYNKKKEMTASKTTRKLDAETLKQVIPGYLYGR